MNNSIMAAVVVLGLPAIIASVNITKSVATEKDPTPIRLSVALVEYVEINGVGHMRQKVVSESGQPIPADWVVQVSEVRSGVDAVICEGHNDDGNPGIYAGETSTYALKEWAGDNACPDNLRPGDRVQVSWTYSNHYEIRETVGTTFLIPEDFAREASEG